MAAARMTRGGGDSYGAAAAASLLVLAACRSLPPGAECFALDGRPLASAPAEPAVQAQRERDLEQAGARAAALPRDRDAAIWVARRLGYLGRFREAVDVLTAALAEHPGDPFVLRHRGHRWITLREPARAAADLEHAAAACRNTPDAVEWDGQPTPGRWPHGTLHFNVHYHLGLARFLLADFDGAERAWLDCLAVAANDEARVAVTHWLWCARVRCGDRAGAAAVVVPIRADMDVVENRAYHQLCLLYDGRLERDDLVVPPGSAGAALRFGLAHFDLFGTEHRAPDEVRRGVRELAGLAADASWAAFGVIAAEAEHARLPASVRASPR